jgi:hypothetical protein
MCLFFDDTDWQMHQTGVKDTCADLLSGVIGTGECISLRPFLNSKKKKQQHYKKAPLYLQRNNSAELHIK